MTWPVALFLVAVSLFALAYVVAIAAMLGLAISAGVARLFRRRRRLA